MTSCPDDFLCLQLKDILSSLILLITVLVIYYGPLKASSFADKAAQRNESRRRKLETFGSLMKTRRVFLAPEHVMALNLIQLEFKDDDKVIKAYTEYIRLRNTQPEKVDERFFEDADNAYFDMVHAIGENLGLNFDRLELKRYSYAPQGWATDEMQMRQVRTLMIELLGGNRALFTINATPTPASGKFPPPPDVKA